VNLSTRSRLSVCQFLILFSRDELVLLFGKYQPPTDALEDRWGSGKSTIIAVRDTVLEAPASAVGELLQEIARTRSSMRTSVSPRYRFDERWEDLERCLELDGYGLEKDEWGRELNRFAPIEPKIDGAAQAEDDLTRELHRSGLNEKDELLRMLDNSADAFRRGNFNGCLGSARVALQSLATSIAKSRQASHPGSFDASKWGQVVAYLRTSGLITQQQEVGITGVFSLLSPGSHSPVGFTEQEFARLGRSLGVSLCYFLVKTFNGPSQ
jgi:hypothetical protein